MTVAPFAHLFIDMLLKVAVIDLTFLASYSYQAPLSARYCHNGHDEAGGQAV